MSHKCDLCDRPATYRSVEIVKGKKIEKHLCEQHAAQAGLAVPSTHTPINQLLTQFVNIHSGAVKHNEPHCENCGMTFTEFREHSLLGCPQCYSAMEEPLSGLLERAHEGATHHVGKLPHRAGADEQQQARLLRMRKRLADAVAAEDYELAARLRDEIRTAEEHRA